MKFIKYFWKITYNAMVSDKNKSNYNMDVDDDKTYAVGKFVIWQPPMRVRKITGSKIVKILAINEDKTYKVMLPWSGGTLCTITKKELSKNTKSMSSSGSGSANNFALKKSTNYVYGLFPEVANDQNNMTFRCQVASAPTRSNVFNLPRAKLFSLSTTITRHENENVDGSKFSLNENVGYINFPAHLTNSVVVKNVFLLTKMITLVSSTKERLLNMTHSKITTWCNIQTVIEKS